MHYTWPHTPPTLQVPTGPLERRGTRYEGAAFWALLGFMTDGRRGSVLCSCHPPLMNASLQLGTRPLVAELDVTRLCLDLQMHWMLQNSTCPFTQSAHTI